MKRLIAILTAVGMAAAGCSSGVTETTTTELSQPTAAVDRSGGTPLIIDTDVALDDIMAIFYLLRRDDIDVLAVTVSGTGVAHCDAGASIVLGILAVAQRDGIPVACGSEDPIEGTNAFPDDWRTAMDVFDASGVLPSGGNPTAGDASSLIAETAAASPIPPVVLVLGPHTNLAQALRDHPDLESQLAGIHMMGGAVATSGNTFVNPRAEWNLWIDPVADDEVLATGLPVAIVPLDATAFVPLTTWFADQLARHLSTPEAQAVHDLLVADPATLSSGLSFWDQLAAVVLVEPEVASWQDLKVTILQMGGSESAGTLAAGLGRPASVAMAADRRAFEREYLSTLTGEDVAASEWTADATLSISESGWHYDGPTTIEAGSITVIVDNQSEDTVGTAHGWLTGTATWEDFEAYTSLAQPPWLEVDSFVATDPRIQAIWTIDLTRPGENILVGLNLTSEQVAWRQQLTVNN